MLNTTTVVRTKKQLEKEIITHGDLYRPYWSPDTIRGREQIYEMKIMVTTEDKKTYKTRKIENILVITKGITTPSIIASQIEVDLRKEQIIDIKLLDDKYGWQIAQH